MTEQNKEKWVFIVNPVAGNGYAATIIPQIEAMIKKHGVSGEIILTEKPGHASLLSNDYYEKGYGHIIGVGGDGTLNEIARSLKNRNDVVIGLIPAGTGNDFIQILGFPGRFEEKEWDIFFRRNTIAMDAGTVNGSIFLNGLGLGFDAQVAAENYIEPGKVRKGSVHKYIWHILKTLILFREKRMIIKTGDKITETDCFINTVSIGRRFAGSFFLTPDAIANDGLLDVCSIKKLSLIRRFNLLMKVPSGKHILEKEVSYYKTSSLNIRFPEKVPYHVDGELFFSDNFDINLLPGAFNIIYNPEGNHFFNIINGQ